MKLMDVIPAEAAVIEWEARDRALAAALELIAATYDG